MITMYIIDIIVAIFILFIHQNFPKKENGIKLIPSILYIHIIPAFQDNIPVRNQHQEKQDNQTLP